MENKKIVFIKPMKMHPDINGLIVDIHNGEEYPISNDPYFGIRVNSSQMSGTIFVKTDSVINNGFAKVVNG